ncbi:hypothetical protein [Paenibacillus roseipurpureus]|uniref:Uncharacterized protein n=1 Tax=Paenibacillus roseopurpureus TaxID=2918901 RepID=A0AA96LRW8_9BACL|nr:hypothetical protein [Paenibacillus sp. MBLB1832]WNR44934.1 hypothetical protein MJB10_01920 [Paenibacillus sp. MBLB1832]
MKRTFRFSPFKASGRRPFERWRSTWSSTKRELRKFPTEETAAGTEEVLSSVESQLHMFTNMHEKALELQVVMGTLTSAVERFRV